jgi:hypothetical protein
VTDQPSRFDELAPKLLSAVHAGATLDEACRNLGVAIGTARGWAYRGRRGSERYAEFARTLEAIRGERRRAEQALDGPVTLAEAEAVLARAVRRGSIPALKLWLERHDRNHQPAEDEFSWLDPR